MKQTIEKFLTLHSVPGGYVSKDINIYSKDFKLSPMSIWHFKHKPYTCDCPPSYARKG